MHRLTQTIECFVSRIRFGVFALGLAAAAALTGCGTAPMTFDSPQTAVTKLVGALRANDDAELKRIFGSDSDDLISSGDEVADQISRKEFVRLFDEQNRLVDEGEGKTLEIGRSGWPFPIPIVQDKSGWFFDTAAGLDELLSRRIGRNELSAIEVVREIADAQREFAAADLAGDGWREYAQRFASEPGKRNGLYWTTSPGEPESPLGPFVADAAEEGYTARRPGEQGPRPFHGYLYRILTAQGPDAPGGSINFIAKGRMIGGFGVIAWPADYGNSGLKSFIISHHGMLYEKDLGDNTDRIARQMAAFNPGAGWVPVVTH